MRPATSAAATVELLLASRCRRVASGGGYCECFPRWLARLASAATYWHIRAKQREFGAVAQITHGQCDDTRLDHLARATEVNDNERWVPHDQDASGAGRGGRREM